jgi:membrane-anchored glycerophosphoryl diester phosphodiesterase (GDPDase)
MNQFINAWKFFIDNAGYLIALALPVAFMEVSMASILQPIQQLTLPEDFVEYINSNGAIFLAVAFLAIIVQMGFLGGLWIGFDSLDNDKDISPLDAQLQALRRVFSILGASIVIGIASFLGFLLLILPGIYVMARLSLTYGYIVLENKSVSDSIQESWRMTDEHGGRLFGLTLSFVTLTIVFSLIIANLIQPGLTNLIFLAAGEYLFALPLGYIYFTLYKSLKNSID